MERVLILTTSPHRRGPSPTRRLERRPSSPCLLGLRALSEGDGEAQSELPCRCCGMQGTARAVEGFGTPSPIMRGTTSYPPSISSRYLSVPQLVSHDSS